MAESNKTQDEYFGSSEGDQYYCRNKTALKGRDGSDDPTLNLIRSYRLNPESVLDLGCSNGWRLACMQQEYGCEAVGVDASTLAVEEGNRDYPNIALHQGMLLDIPIHGRTFDLVMAVFVLHWVGRENLLRTIGEIDRMVSDGGYLVIADFYPDSAQRTLYHHDETGSTYTYKQHYAEIFTVSHLYREVARLSFDTKKSNPMYHTDFPERDRGCVTLLRKSLHGNTKPDGES